MSGNTELSDEVREHAGLVEVFRTMKFTETEADRLAGARIAPERAQKLLSRGCTHRLAVLILV